MKAGDISIDLVLDNKQFSVQVRNSGALLSQLQRNLEQTARSSQTLERRFGGFTAGLRHVVLTAASVRFALMDINDVFLSLPSAILKTTGEFERVTQLLKGLSTAAGETERLREAGDNFKYILDASKNAPFQIGALTDAFVKFKAGGLDPLDGSFKALINGVARFGGDSEALKRASVAIQQMSGKGVISMEELRQQLGEAVPTAMRMMAVGMGMSMGDLTKAVSKGTVESSSALRRMFAVMSLESAGAAEEMMSTWSGLTSRLKTEWEILKNDAGRSEFAAEMKRQISGLTAVMDTLQGRRFAADVGASLASIVRGFGDAVRMAYEFSNALKGVAYAASTAFVVNKIGNWVGEIRKANASRIAEIARGVQEERALKAVRARDEATAAAQRSATNAANLTAERKHIYDLLRQKREFNAQLRVLEAEETAIRAREARLRTVSLGAGRLSPELITNNNHAAMVRANIVANEALIASGRAQVANLKEQQRELTKTATAKLGLASAATKAATSLGVMGKAMVAGQWVLAAMGGWVGALTLAISAAAAAWVAFGKNGEEALSKLRDAVNRGLADKDTVASLQQRQDELPGVIEALESKVAYGEAMQKALGPLFPEVEKNTLEGLKQELAQRKKEFEGIGKEIAEATSQALSNGSTDAVNAINRDAEAQKKAIQSKFNAERSVLEEQHKQQLDQLRSQGLDKAKLAAAEKKENERYLKASADAYKAQQQANYDGIVAIEQKALERVAAVRKAGGNQYELAAAENAAAQAAQLRDQERQALENAKLIGTAGEMLGGTKATKPDPLTRQLARAGASLQEALIRLDDLSDGVVTYQRLYESTLAKLRGDRAGGSLNATDSQLEQLAHVKTQEEAVSRLARATLNLNKIQSRIEADRALAAERFTDDAYYEKESTGVTALTRQLKQLETQIPANTKGLDALKARFGTLISRQALVDLMNFGADLKKQTEEIRIALIPTEKGRQEAAFAAEMAAAQRALDARLSQIDEEALAEDEARQQKQAAEEAFLNWRLARYQQHANEMKTPLQRLTADWLDSERQVNDMTANWSKQSIDWLTDLAITGKFKWREMLASMLTDTLRTNLQTAFGQSINGAFGAVGEWIKAGLRFVTPAQEGDAATGAAGALEKSLISVAAESDILKSTFMSNSAAVDAMTTATGLGRAAMAGNATSVQLSSQAVSSAFGIVASTANQLAFALANAAAAASGNSAGSIISSIAAGLVSGLGSGGSTAVGSVDGMTGTWGPVAQFANGGIMTSAGSLPLHAYATGGIARSAQLALFGEGSTAEAFVPLPDGRSIPVSLQGNLGGGQAVNVSIVINEGEGGQASGSGNANEMWRAFGKQIATLVQQKLVEEKRPGGLLASN